MMLYTGCMITMLLGSQSAVTCRCTLRHHSEVHRQPHLRHQNDVIGGDPVESPSHRGSCVRTVSGQ